MRDVQVGVGVHRYKAFEPHGDVFEVGLAVLVGAHEFQRRQHGRVDAGKFKISQHQSRRHKLALGQYLLLVCLGEIDIDKRADVRQTAVDVGRGLLAHLGSRLAHHRTAAGARRRRIEQFGDNLLVPALHGVDRLAGPRLVLFV